MIKLLNNSRYFNTTINSLSESLIELGIHHEIVTEIDETNDIFIVCTTHEHRPLPKKYISYNCEQLTTDKRWDHKIIDKFKKAIEVWDYSLENIKLLRLYKINALHLPIGYSKCMEIDKTDEEKSIDLLFIGCINELRLQKLNDLRLIYYKNPEKFLITNDCWDYSIYNKTKIGLNLHFYNGKTILEVHRIIPMIANKIIIVSEKSDDLWYDSKYENIIDFTNNFVKTVILTLKNNNLKELAEGRYQYLINHCKFVDYVKILLDKSTIKNYIN
jgi:hypothetical protein